MPTIDFITLSRGKEIPRHLGESIALMIADQYPWHLTIVDGDKYDLFSGFNYGVTQVEGDILAFVHDDVRFLANALALVRPLKLLENPSCGFIGVAGSRVLGPDGCWWGYNSNPAIKENCRGMVAHRGDNEFGLNFDIWPSVVAVFGEVLVLDGAFLMCHRRTFEKVGGFDARTFKGFHFYDVDITFRAAVEHKLRNYAAPIPLLHGSTGGAGAEWDANRKVFIEKFGHLLPAQV
jgi:hypothetical protein